MVKKKKTKNTRVVQKIGKAQIILKVFCYTPIAKPLNGSLQWLSKESPNDLSCGMNFDNNKRL